MKKQSMMVKKIVADIVVALSTNMELCNQLDLFMSLRKRSISVDDFFVKQKEIDEVMLKNSEEVDDKYLKRLNPKTYEHEIKHKSVWDKYGVQSKIYCWHKRNHTYLVLDLDFEEVAKKKKYDSDQIVNIYKEMQRATFLDKDIHGYDVVMDILQYEVLNGLEDLEEVSLYNLFSKYNWEGVQI